MGFCSVDALPYLGPRPRVVAAGDLMVVSVVPVERLRPVGLLWAATLGVGTSVAAGAGRTL